jgi:hypothetical protein
MICRVTKVDDTPAKGPSTVRMTIALTSRTRKLLGGAALDLHSQRLEISRVTQAFGSLVVCWPFKRLGLL